MNMKHIILNIINKKEKKEGNAENLSREQGRRQVQFYFWGGGQNLRLRNH